MMRRDRVRRWLLQTKEGQRLMDELLDTLDEHVFTTERGQAIQQRVLSEHERSQHIVVELCANGEVNVYGPRTVHVEVVNRPSVRRESSNSVVDDLINSQLGLRFKEVYWPAMKRAVARWIPMTFAGTVDMQVFDQALKDRAEITSMRERNNAESQQEADAAHGRSAAGQGGILTTAQPHLPVVRGHVASCSA